MYEKKRERKIKLMRYSLRGSILRVREFTRHASIMRALTLAVMD